MRLAQSHVRLCVRLCAAILQPPPPSAPFGSALSRMVIFDERNETGQPVRCCAVQQGG